MTQHIIAAEVFLYDDIREDVYSYCSNHSYCFFSICISGRRNFDRLHPWTPDSFGFFFAMREWHM
jgi:hypothetical protein